MSCWLTTNYQLYPGHNQAGNLAPITTYYDANSVYFIEPAGIAHSRRGQLEIASNGTPDYSGFHSIDWIFGWLTYRQWEYAKANWEGLVTIKVAANSSSFANYNAILRIEDPADMTFDNVITPTYVGGAFINAPFHYTRLVAL